MLKNLLAVMAAALAIEASSAPAALRTLCASEQSTLFSCSTGANLVSVCGSTDLSASAATLQYRFGRPGKAWVHPAEGLDWRPLTHAGTWTFSGGGGAWLAFAKKTHRYTVYTAVGQGWRAKAGVVVEQGGQRVAHLRCRAAPRSDLGPALFERAGLADEGDTFTLP
jgi:hypothetical protein